MAHTFKKPNKPATMRDVARLAGVSQPTVSRVLNQVNTSIPVSDETRERVLAAIQELAYRPNFNARSLRTQRTQMIALLIADISNSFYHPIARAVQDVARLHDYDVLIANSDHVYENEKHFCEAVTRRPVDGVVMVPIHLTNDDLDRFMTETNTPIAVLGKQINHPNIDVAHVDGEKAMYEVTRWMINERGYTSLGFVGVPDDLPPAIPRARGFNRALHDAGLHLDPRFVVQGDFTMESGIAAAHDLLRVGELPRALFVLNDLMAIGMILALQEAGFNVPEDIAVMGFDNIPEATFIRPALTTIAQDPRDIGQWLAETLFDRILNPTPRPRREYESTYKLIVRQSA